MKKLTLPPSIEAMENVATFIETFMEEHDMPMKLVMKVNIAVDEIFSNIAYYSHATDATISCGILDGALILQFTDNGKPYNPLEKDDPDITLSAEEREIGGLGIYMVKQFMDLIEYRYEDGYNHLTLKKSFD